MFSEIIRNVLEHSHAPTGANVCAVFNKEKGKLRIGIADAGIGVPNSMKFNHRVDSHLNAIILALQPGITGTTSRLGGTPDNAGAGLFMTKAIAQATRNHFLIYSGDAYFKLKITPERNPIKYFADPKRDNHSKGEGFPNFNGTVIGIDITTKESPAFANIITRIGDIYQLSVKQAKKDFYKKIRFV